MSEINLNLFRVVIAPEYATMSDVEIETFGSEAELEVSKTAWGKLYPRALALVTAHLIAMSKKSAQMGGNAATGALTKTKVGDLERTFSDSSSSSNGQEYKLTTYGSEYIRLRKKLLTTPIIVS